MVLPPWKELPLEVRMNNQKMYETIREAINPLLDEKESSENKSKTLTKKEKEAAKKGAEKEGEKK